MNKFLIAIMLTMTPLLSAEVVVKTSRNAVKLNESFTVTFTTQEALKQQPDFSPMERDFEIISRNQSHKTRIINGEYSNEDSWSLTLFAKKEGDATIPSIAFGQVKSDPLTIKVKGVNNQQKTDSLYLEVELSPKQEVFEQSQLIYTIRLYRSVNLYQGILNEPKVNDPDALVERLNEDREYDQMTNGTHYVVLERTYSIFPSRPGTLTVSPIQFEGQTIIGGHSLFDVQTQYVRKTSEPLSIQVKPVPAPFTKQNWFPSEDVALADEWSIEEGKATQGDVITRTVTITSKGCLANQIPTLNMNIPSDLKQYPEKAVLNNKTSGQDNIGISKIKVAMIPSKSGRITIPEIVVKWWDLKENRVRESRLPEVTIDVAPNNLAETIPPVIKEEPVKSPDVQQPPLPTWVWMLLALNGIIAMVLIRKWCGRACNFAGHLPKKESPSQIRQLIKSACMANNGKEVEKQLLRWAMLTFGEPIADNLALLKEHLPENLRAEVEKLNQSLYGQNPDWKGESLWIAFSRYTPPPQQSPKPKSSLLRNLYPF